MAYRAGENARPMSRLEKKCFMVSTVLHGLLIAVFLFGSAFLTAKREIPRDIQPLTMVPAIVVDGLPGGGGNPTIQPTEEKVRGETLTPQPPTLPPPPEPKKVEKVEPNPEPVRTESKPTPRKQEEFKLPKTAPKDPARLKEEPKTAPKKQHLVDVTKVAPRSN